jgi:hypothetical protein
MFRSLLQTPQISHAFYQTKKLAQKPEVIFGFKKIIAAAAN